MGWQPARNNFVLRLSRDQESGVFQSRVVVEGVQGVWSRGVVVRGQCYNDIMNT